MAGDGRYFDGHSSRPWQVSWRAEAGRLHLQGEATADVALHHLEFSEPLPGVPRQVTLPGGALLEVAEGRELDALLAQAGARRGGWRPQRLRNALALVAVVLALLAGALLYGMPLVVDWVAAALPARTQQALGAGTLAMLDREAFGPSRLPQARQDALRGGLARLRPPSGSFPAHELVFRHSTVGPNAFSLPSGTIVLTDELVALADSDEALMGVLAHELGHLQRRHALRTLIQAAAVGAVGTLLLGDVSSVLAMAPAALINLKYSRDFEREADDYAVATLQASGLSTEGLARLFERLARREPGWPAYLGSHPASAERIARLRAQH